MQLVAQIEILNAKLSMSAFGAMQTLGGAVSGGAAAAACAAPARWLPRKTVVVAANQIDGVLALVECSFARGIRNPSSALPPLCLCCAAR